MTQPRPSFNAIFKDFMEAVLVRLRDGHKCPVAWEWTGDPMASIRNEEQLEYEAVHLATRSYK